ncbi:MAG: alpha/beta fold hydrolase, partial [Flavobacteriales bacterium]
KQNMSLYYQFKENTILNKEFLDIEKISQKIKVPFCVIHGRKDIAVREEEATNLDKWIPTSQLILIEDATHTFGSYHPYDKNELPEDLKMVVDESINFLEIKKSD